MTKISACDYRGSSNFRITSLNLWYFCENSNSWLQGQLRFSSESIRLVLLLVDISHRDNRASSNFQVISSKRLIFARIFVIIWEVKFSIPNILTGINFLNEGGAILSLTKDLLFTQNLFALINILVNVM